MTISTYLWPGTVHFGFGAVAMAAQEAVARDLSRAFIIADRGVIEAGLLDGLTAALQAAKLDYVIFDEVVANPDVDTVNSAAAALRASGADLIIGLGGGSSLDTAKAVKLLAGGPAEASIWEYATMLGEEKRPLPARHEMPPFFAVPTTAGTGAEVTPWAVITRRDKEMKFGVGHVPTTPEVALVDPGLTMTLPAHLTAATAMDALSHLVEAYVSTNHNPILDPMILYGIELIGRSVRTAVARGDNREARSDVLEASLIGGIAISSKWLGACHSLAHPLSGLAGMHHGLACAITLPHQMRYSCMGALERYGEVAVALDEGWLAEPSPRARALGAADAVAQLLQDLGLPDRLRDVGVAQELIPDLAAAAINDLNWWTNPRAVSEEALAEMYTAAW